MRLVLYLTISLALAAAILIALVMADVLVIEPDGGETTGLSSPRQATTASVAGDVSEPIESDGERPQIESATDEEIPPAGGAGRANIELHAKAVSFLSSHEGESGDDMEDRFRDFLLRECGVDQSVAERFVRMAFWKNFVTLQDQWEAGEIDSMRSAFAREKELKRAGFAARGLAMMQSEIDAAEEERKHREEQMSLHGRKESK